VCGHLKKQTCESRITSGKLDIGEKMKKTMKEKELELQKEKALLANKLEKLVKMQADLESAKKAEAAKKALAEKAKAEAAKKAAKLDRFILGYNDEDKVEVKPVVSAPPIIRKIVVEDEKPSIKKEEKPEVKNQGGGLIALLNKKIL
jgi:tRNA nucleotidyltransferase/poly(A) polymerase